MISLGLEVAYDFDGSIEFTIDNPKAASPNVHVENWAPYSLMGDNNIPSGLDYRGWPATTGNHTVKIRSFSGKNLGGSELCSFERVFRVVVDSDSDSAGALARMSGVR